MDATTPQSPPPAASPAPAPPEKKGTSPIVWIAVGCGGLLLLFAIVAMLGAFFVYNKVKDARHNPALAAAKLMTLGNRDLVIVRSDDRAQTVTIRDKRTGREVTVDLDQIKQGRITFRDEKGEQATIETKGEGGEASIKMTGEKGTVTMGTGAEGPPAWVPTYAGIKPVGVASVRSQEEVSGTYTFETRDSPEQVAKSFESELKKAGFKVTTTSMSTEGRTAGGMVSGVTEGEKRAVNVILSTENGMTKAVVTYAEKL